jgi:hypothetical protein
LNSLKPYKIINDIANLTHEKFVSCVCDSDLNVLIIEGSPDPADLLECWANIYAQYLDLAGDSETLYIMILKKDVEVLNFRIITAEAIVKVLEFYHVNQLVDALKQLRFDVKNLVQDHPGYKHALKKILSRIAHYKLKLQQKIQELSEYEDTETETVRKEHFTRQLVRLSKYQGYQLKSKKLMMPDYVAILKEFLHHLELKQHVNDGEAR